MKTHRDARELMEVARRRDLRTSLGIMVALVLLMALGLWASTVWGQSFPPSTAVCLVVSPLESLATSYASATSTSTAQTLTVPTNAVMAVITLNSATSGGGIVYRDDGGTPQLYLSPANTFIGMPLSVVTAVTSTTTLVLCQPQLKRFSFISNATGAAVLNIAFYGR